MKCPTCVNTMLVMSERQGVEIDYCPECRGLWLDRGELDKLLERAAAQSVPQPSAQRTAARDDHYAPRPYSGHDHGHGRHDKYYKHKSWLSEIFD